MWHLFESVLVLLGVALRYIRLHLPTFASAVTVPIASASPPPPRSQARNMYLFEQTVTVLFITDCTLELQYGVHGSLRVGDPLGSNRSNYLSGCWFWIDFPSSVPVELIDYVAECTGHLSPTGNRGRTEPHRLRSAWWRHPATIMDR